MLKIEFRILLFAFTAIMSMVSTKATERNGYLYTIDVVPGTVIMNQKATMIGRAPERYKETSWFCTTAEWNDNGLYTLLTGLKVQKDYWGKCEYLYATGAYLEHIYKFEVAGVSHVYLGDNNHDRPINCTIESEAFRNSSKTIIYIELNKGIRDVNSYAFANMTKGSIRCKGTPPDLDSRAFNDTAYENVKVIVNDDQLANYKKSSWSRFKYLMSETQSNTIIYFTRGCPTQVDVGSTIRMVLNINTEDKNLMWKSSDESIATVENGIVTGHKCGEVTISATYINGETAKCVVNVVRSVTALDIIANNQSVSGKELQMVIGETEKLNARIIPDDASNKSVKWFSNNTDVITITDDGLISAIGLGKASITCSALDGSGIEKTCHVIVTPLLIKSMSINPKEYVGKAGDEFSISTNISPDKATIKEINWTSSNNSVATVTYDGKVTLHNVGNCIITARTTDGSNLEDQCIVNVIATPAESISLDKKQWYLYVGEKIKLNAEVLPVTTTNKTIGWTSSDLNIANVDQNGTVTAVGIGEATITASCGNLTTKCLIKVIEIPVSSIQLDKTDVNIHVGETVQLKAIVLPENATNKTITWSTSNEDVAIVSDKGLVTAVKEGSAIISAKCGQFNAICQVSVLSDAKSISLNTYQASLKVGECIQLTATVLPETTSNKTVSWRCSDNDIAIVDENGRITAFTIGKAEVTATTYNGLKATCEITVIPTPASSLTLNKTEVILKETETMQLYSVVYPEDTTDKTIIWTSSDESVAEVDLRGLLTGNSIGKAIITATCGIVSATCAVSVIPTQVESISLNMTKVNLKKSENVQLFATILPVNATNKNLVWSSSDISVATVDDHGLLTAVKSGECTVTASAIDGSGISASCAVSVEPILIESLSISPEEFMGSKGSSFTIVPTILPENADNKVLTYSSSNENVAGVNDSGIVTLKKEGIAVIKVRTTDGSNIEAQCIVAGASGINDIFTDDSVRCDVYDTTGILLRKDADKEYVSRLSKGVYIIVNGNKFIKLNLRGY